VFFQTYYRSVKAVKVVMDPVTGLCKGYGFVRFFDEGEQVRALTEMQGAYIGSRPIRVSVATPRNRPTLSALGTPVTVGTGVQGATGGSGWALPTVTQAAPAGRGGVMPGYGGLASQMANSVPLAVGAVPMAHAGGYGAQVGVPPVLAPPPPGWTPELHAYAADPNHTTLHVAHLYGVDSDSLLKHVRSFGDVIYCFVPEGNVGYGVVQFSTRKEAEDAMKALNGKLLGTSSVQTMWGKPPQLGQVEGADPLSGASVATQNRMFAEEQERLLMGEAFCHVNGSMVSVL